MKGIRQRWRDRRERRRAEEARDKRFWMLGWYNRGVRRGECFDSDTHALMARVQAEFDEWVKAR